MNEKKKDPETDKICIFTFSHKEKGYSVKIESNRYLNIILAECTK